MVSFLGTSSHLAGYSARSWGPALAVLLWSAATPVTAPGLLSRM